MSTVPVPKRFHAVQLYLSWKSWASVSDRTREDRTPRSLFTVCTEKRPEEPVNKLTSPNVHTWGQTTHKVRFALLYVNFKIKVNELIKWSYSFCLLFGPVLWAKYLRLIIMDFTVATLSIFIDDSVTQCQKPHVFELLNNLAFWGECVMTYFIVLFCWKFGNHVQC